MWNRLIAWWEAHTRRKELRGPLPIHADVLRDRLSRAEIQVMTVIAILIVVPAGVAGYFYYTQTHRAERELADGIRLVSPGHYDEAVMQLTIALGNLPSGHPNRYMGYLMRGTAYRMKTDRLKAKADFDTAIGLRPDCTRCYVERAGLARETKEYDLALADLDRAGQTMDRQPDTYVERALIYEEMDQPAKAIEEFSKAITLRSEWTFLYRARARNRKKMGDIEGYESDKQTVIKIEGYW